MRKRLTTWAVLAGAGVLAYLALSPRHDPAPPGEGSAALSGREAPARRPADDTRYQALPERSTIGEPRADLFASRSWAPRESPKPVARGVPPPAPPAMPYKFAGQLVHEGSAQLFLAKGNVVLPVREGDTLDGSYRVESIAADKITLLYLPLGTRETIPVSSTLGLAAPLAASTPSPREGRSGPPDAGATPSASEQAAPAASGAAQLRWEGPGAVQRGSSFNVALRMTSAQPVRASPLQLRFDPKLLEPLAVRPGKFFQPGSGSFSYRIGTDGAIFVGASGQGAAASDAELLVLTFKPIQSGATAEINVSALNLQGAGGRSIGYEQLAAFRTAIQR